ncbi:MAG: cohesin domain-containing protein [Candidatus Poribacteria bacterium]|nr:cohesin domain-containing protein [Candidatus Poribacteria bacterium]
MIKKTLVSIFSTFLLISIPYLPNTFAQNYTKWNLPEGVKVRLGKGWISGDIAYSPDGTRLAVSSSIGIWIYDANTYAEVALFTEHTQPVNSVAYSPDGKMLVSGSADNTVRLWNAHTGQLLNTLEEHTGDVTSVAFSPNGKMFVSGSRDNTARLWDTDTGQLLRTFRMIPKNYIVFSGSFDVNSVAFSPDGKFLATGSDNAIRLWDVNTGERLASSGVDVGYAVTFSSDDVTLASAEGRGGVKLWGARTGKHWQTLRGHTGGVYSVAFSPDGKILASGGADREIRLWDARTGVHLRTLERHTSPILSMSFSPNGRTLASASWTEVRFWNTNTNIQKHIIEGHTRSIYSVAISPDGSIFASGYEDGTIMLSDPHSGQHRHTFIGHSGKVNALAFSPDGSTLASGGGERWGQVKLWDTRTWEHLHTLTGHKGAVLSVAFSPDSSMIASGAADSETTQLWNVSKQIRLWNVRTGKHLHTLRTSKTGYAYSVAFSPDGMTLASGGSGNTIQLWDVRTGRLLQTLLNKNNSFDNNRIYSVAFSPDGSTLASGDRDYMIRLWNPRSGEFLRTLKAHKNPVISIVYSPDGNTLASTCWRNIIFWDTHTGELTRVILAHTGYINSIAFSPDGSTLMSGSGDGTVMLWDLTPSDIPDTTPSPPATPNTTVSLSPSPVQSPAIGQQLTLSLKIAKGEDVAGYQATVEFDATTLRYVESTNGDYLPKGAFFVPPVSEGNTVTLASTALGGKSDGSGTLATITFEVVAAKASTVRLSDVLLTDSEGGSSTPQIENADITEPPKLPEDVNKDGVVNIIDLTLVASSFGKSGQNSADVNGDGIVNIIDLTLVAAAFGNTAAAPEVWSRHTEVTPTREQVEQWLHQARQMNLTDSTFQRGLLMLERLLATLTPKETALLPNYPNPFNPETWIPYQLAESADVSISIYAADGTLVRTLALGYQAVGIYESRSHAAYWDGKNALGEPVASGVYFYRFTAGDFSATRKMLIRK